MTAKEPTAMSEDARRVIYAANQPEYLPLPALVFPDGKVLTEWEPTEAERLAIAHGEHIRLWIWTFNGPLQPVAIEVTSEDKP